jgi:hypothetical protein
VDEKAQPALVATGAGWLDCAGRQQRRIVPAQHQRLWLRRLIWFGIRNPGMNFVGFVVGVEDRNYTVTGVAPALAITGRDCGQEGWRWSVINLKYVKLPSVSCYKNGFIEFYLGRRPASGGFVIKIVHGKPPGVA